MSPFYWFLASLRESWFLWTLIVVNFFGSIYGFYWYGEQLHETTPGWLTIFVPDSPTGSSLFTLYLIFLLLGRSFGALEAFAAITNFKYGVWAVSVILAGFAMGGESHWTDYMLMASHGGMAVESLLYARFYSIRLSHIFMVAIWTLLNDYMDYAWNLHPWLPDVLDPFTGYIGMFTVLLSFFCLLLFWRLSNAGK